MADHDSAYHLIFSDPAMVAELLQEFVGEPWVGLLDLTRMERINAKLHADIGVRRDGDVIWRIPMQDGQDAYLVVLIEFQSRSDRFMALRTLVYVALLWQQLLREKRIPETGLLPPVFPVTVYNGDARWSAPLRLAELIGLAPGSPLWRWQPDSSYLVIDEGAYDPADLAARDALTALLFRIEQPVEVSDVLPIADAVVDWFDRHEGFQQLRAVFAQLIGGMFQGTGGPDAVPEDLREVKAMLATRVEAWERKLRQDAREEGLEEGLAAGTRAGEIAMLVRLLERKFGRVPDELRRRLAGADKLQLEVWADALIDARSMEELFR